MDGAILYRLLGNQAAAFECERAESERERSAIQWSRVMGTLAEIKGKLLTDGIAGDRDALNPGDVAKELRVSPDTVHNWIRTKQLAAANLATGSRPRWVIQRRELEKFLRLRSI